MAPTIPEQTDFAHWALPAELARRARAAGWEVERCDRFDDGTWVTTNCDLRRDGSYAFVAVDELNSADAAEEQVSFAEPIEAVTRDGDLVLSARVFDRQSAADIRDALAPNGVPLLGVDEATLRGRLSGAGWTLNWCEVGSDPELLQLDCEVERDGLVGFVDVEQERHPGAYRPPQPKGGTTAREG